jgi:hypothetical protein
MEQKVIKKECKFYIIICVFFLPACWVASIYIYEICRPALSCEHTKRECSPEHSVSHVKTYILCSNTFYHIMDLVPIK